jgi:hypothetical protein
MDALGQAGSDYRWNLYDNGFSGDLDGVGLDRVLAFLDLAQRFVEHTIRANERPDHLYHAYNVLHLGAGVASVDHLYEMLEGQVAVLSSGLLSAEQALALLRSLRASSMYRADQHSYMLYPDRDLPGFLQKNQLSPDRVQGSALIAALVEDGDRTLVLRDENSAYHFCGSFRNARDVKRALAALEQRERYAALVDAERDHILALFEQTFHHNAFTGRSGTFFAYEGLGSIYWHMVSKLLLAVQETTLRAIEDGAPQVTVEALAEAYYDVRRGIGFNKPPDRYGAFPTDPYSHTPAAQGAKQPGMTGQVKEELLTRMGELGVSVERGTISFRPVMLKRDEFLDESTLFAYLDIGRLHRSIALPAGALAFTYCQVPIVYVIGDQEAIEIRYADGVRRQTAGADLDVEASQHILQRDGQIAQVTVTVCPSCAPGARAAP